MKICAFMEFYFEGGRTLNQLNVWTLQHKGKSSGVEIKWGSGGGAQWWGSAVVPRAARKCLTEKLLLKKLWKEQWMYLGEKHSRQWNSKLKVLFLSHFKEQKGGRLFWLEQRKYQRSGSRSRCESREATEVQIIESWQSHENFDFYSKRYRSFWKGLNSSELILNFYIILHTEKSVRKLLQSFGGEKVAFGIRMVGWR